MYLSKKFWAGIVSTVVLAVAIAPMGHADTTAENSPRCMAATPREAKALADELYRRGEFQQSGVCYQAAGDFADANEAFVKATPGNSDATAKELGRQGQIAKTLFTNVQQAFRSNH